MIIKYNKEIYPLDKTEMIMTITLPIHYTNVSINVEKLFEIVPITIEYNNKLVSPISGTHKKHSKKNPIFVMPL
jgi:hypothetical protein